MIISGTWLLISCTRSKENHKRYTVNNVQPLSPEERTVLKSAQENNMELSNTKVKLNIHTCTQMCVYVDITVRHRVASPLSMFHRKLALQCCSKSSYGSSLKWTTE